MIYAFNLLFVIWIYELAKKTDKYPTINATIKYG